MMTIEDRGFADMSDDKNDKSETIKTMQNRAAMNIVMTKTRRMRK